ncbi:acyltransferase family protein [Franconibacter helveticus]|uniref:acyltransferase family protein n=1 Tax=Franconibacter helveticus TaxID=357240 RepID=UPI000DA19106|nr:acyltransferase [Franconibacter helveticus]
MNVKRFVEIDSLRVIASILVFISHFSYYFLEGSLSSAGHDVAGMTGRFAVNIFFGVSGYLVAHSLSQKDALSLFYIKRAIRVLIPYNVAYFFMGFLMVALGAVNIAYFSGAPITNIILNSGEYSKLIPIMLGMDGILNIYFDREYYFLTGEWFIGAIIFMYMLSPLLYKVIDTKLSNALLFMILVILFSTIMYYQVDGRIKVPFWFFLARLPELYLGMMLYRYQHLVDLYKKETSLVVISILAIYLVITLSLFPNPFLADCILPVSPSSWFFSLPLVTLTFIVVRHLNILLDCSAFNSLAKISYPFMLIQHAIINIYLPHLPTKEFSIFGYFFVLLTLMTVTYILSIRIKKIAAPIEKFLLKKASLLYATPNKNDIASANKL